VRRIGPCRILAGFSPAPSCKILKFATNAPAGVIENQQHIIRWRIFEPGGRDIVFLLREVCERRLGGLAGYRLVKLLLGSAIRRRSGAQRCLARGRGFRQPCIGVFRPG
jgi:hypothetical protein